MGPKLVPELVAQIGRRIDGRNFVSIDIGLGAGEQQEQTINALTDWNPDFVAANHCTGFPMMAALYARFGTKYISAFVGTVIEC